MPELPQRDECTNILILGETGVGKSTFVNSLYNYFTYETLDDAMNGDLKILIPTTFQLTEHNVEMTSRTIKASPNVLEENHTENENLEVGQSATNNPRAYLFTEGNRRIRIIDTPGIGDTRGINQDDENITKILSFISQYRELHAICILLKPNEARLTTTFKFCINELLVHLHLSAARNILFCFTNARACSYKPGDTLTILKEHVNQYRANGVELRLDATTIFCFDNESFRFLCARAAGFKEIADDIRAYRDSWKKSVEETEKLFSLIQGRPAHQISDTLCLNITKRVLSALTAPMMDIARAQIINRNYIEERKKEIEQLELEAEDFRNHLYYDQIETIFVQLEKPQMICTSDKCATNLVDQIYGSVCVEDPELSTVETYNRGNPELREFLHLVNDICECGCHWNQHMLLKYTREEIIVTKTNEEIIEAIALRNNEQYELADIVQQLDEKLAEIEEEHNILVQCCTSLASYVREGALLTYNISHGEYIDYLIRLERQTNVNGQSLSIIEGLQNMRQQHEMEINLLTLPTTVTTMTVQETLQKLRELNHCHPIDKYISDVQQLLPRDENRDRDVVVNVVKKERRYLQTLMRACRNLFTGL